MALDLRGKITGKLGGNQLEALKALHVCDHSMKLSVFIVPAYHHSFMPCVSGIKCTPTIHSYSEAPPPDATVVARFMDNQYCSPLYQCNQVIPGKDASWGCHCDGYQESAGGSGTAPMPTVMSSSGTQSLSLASNLMTIDQLGSCLQIVFQGNRVYRQKTR